MCNLTSTSLDDYKNLGTSKNHWATKFPTEEVIIYTKCAYEVPGMALFMHACILRSH